MLKDTVHNYCSLLLFAAGKAGASTAPNIPDVLFPPFPFFACTKHPTSKSGTDLCRRAVMPTSSHVYPTVWSQHGAPSLPHLSPPFPVPIPLCHPPVCGSREQQVPVWHRWRVVAQRSRLSMKQQIILAHRSPAPLFPLPSFTHFTAVRLPQLLVSRLTARSPSLPFSWTVTFISMKHLLSQQWGDFGKSFFSKHCCWEEAVLSVVSSDSPSCSHLLCLSASLKLALNFQGHALPELSGLS